MLQLIKIWCFVRGHRRSRSRARWDDGGVLRSRCKRCRTPLLREWNGDWTVSEQL